MLIPGTPLHLTYSTNVHPGESWSEVRGALEQYPRRIRARLNRPGPFGIGLRLSNRAADELLRGDNLALFKQWLEENSLYVFTINGFPFGDFHGKRVKEQVFGPDWAQPIRREYTLRLARILATLLPEGLVGSISTVPLSYKGWSPTEQQRARVLENVTQQIAQTVASLAEIAQRQQREIVLALEPEPDALLETTDDLVTFFSSWLLAQGVTIVAERMGVTQEEARMAMLRHVGVCWDSCHQAVEFEEPDNSFERLSAQGIRVAKLQISNALKWRVPEERGEQGRARSKLTSFAEPRYLHQVVLKRRGGERAAYADLHKALSSDLREDAEWRIHYHVPVFAGEVNGIGTTQQELLKTLQQANRRHLTTHLEIETYTWGMLPQGFDLSAAIAAEYRWVLEALASKGAPPAGRAP